MTRSEPICLDRRRIVLTGGTGFLGRSLLDYAVDSFRAHGSDFEIRILSRDPETFLCRYPKYRNIPCLSFVQGALTNVPDSLGDATDVIHAAADAYRLQADPLQWFEQIVAGTRTMLEFAHTRCSGRFLLASSGAIYGEGLGDGSGFREDCRCAPTTTDRRATYAHCKRLAEHLCELYRCLYGVETVIARYFSILSGHVPLDGPYAAGNFLRDALYSERVVIDSDGSALRTYLDGRDMAHWTFVILTRGEPGEAYNVGSDQPISIRDFAHAIVRLVSPDKEVRVRGASPQSVRSVYLPDISKAGRLGLRVETQLPESILAAAAEIKALRRGDSDRSLIQSWSS